MIYSDEFDIQPALDIKANMKTLRNTHIQYGWLEKRMHKVKRGESLPTAQLMYFNEFGTINQVARPYMHWTEVELIKEGTPLIAQHFINNLKSRDYTEEGSDALISFITKKFKEVKKRGKPLAKNTVKEKGHNVHLLETGKALDEWQAVLKKTKLKDM